jgi:hypothetical protein
MLVRFPPRKWRRMGEKTYRPMIIPRDAANAPAPDAQIMSWRHAPHACAMYARSAKSLSLM